MRSASGKQWEIRRLMPREFCRLSLLCVCFCGTLAAGLFFSGLGVFLAIQQKRAEPLDVRIGPFVVILTSTGGSIVFATIVWAAAGKPVSGWDPATDYLQSMAPAHLQKWTHQEHLHQGMMATGVAVVWHVVGLLSLAHYCFTAWPDAAAHAGMFALFEVMGALPVALAVKGWKQRRTEGDTLRPAG